MKTKNIERYDRAARRRYYGDGITRYCLHDDVSNPAGGYHEVPLPYVVELKHSRGLTAWLNRSCKGWYASRCNWPYYTARTPDNEYLFELERDAALAKLFHGAGD